MLKKFYLTDEYEDDDMILESESSSKSENNNIIEGSNETDDIKLDDYETDDSEESPHNIDDGEESPRNTSEPKIEFIIEEDENHEKQIRMNFEFKVSDINETIKINLEISRKTYLEIADELLK